MPSISFSTRVNLKEGGNAWVEKPNFYSHPTRLCFLKESETLPTVSLLHVPINGVCCCRLSLHPCPLSPPLSGPGSIPRSFCNSVTQQRFVPEQHDPNPWHQGFPKSQGWLGAEQWPGGWDHSRSTCAYDLAPSQGPSHAGWRGKHGRPSPCRICSLIEAGLSDGYGAPATLKK